jgi:hypothetical protein
MPLAIAMRASKLGDFSVIDMMLFETKKDIIGILQEEE